MNITELNATCDKAERKIKLARAEFPKLIAIFNSVASHYVYYYPDTAKIIARVPTRADFAPIRALKSGKWKKRVQDDEGVIAARYEAITDNGIEIICYVKELPPSCHVVEEKRTLPAQPEREIIERRVICEGATKEEVFQEAMA